ncbi:MAG TPA: AAA family ATPase [Tepidisphaeraceae bacterium]|jgi:hypothetical protein|nr:AAA family ATPase [Tepidisphaeraceae bacterium]
MSAASTNGQYARDGHPGQDWGEDDDDADRSAWMRDAAEDLRARAGPTDRSPPPPPLKFSGIGIGQLMDACPDLRAMVIDGLLRRGETMNVISAPKIGKSWLTLHIALCIVTGTPIFGLYRVARGRVLLLDNELHRETLAKRVKIVADAMCLPRDRYEHDLIVQPMRGQLRDWQQLRGYFASVPPGHFALIICDAFYRFMPADSDENDNGTMASVYNLIDAFAEQTGASFVLVHHSSKGVQSDKSVTDVGAGAGAQSRATDTHLILRHHENDGVVVLDAAVRSWKPIEAVCLRWDFPLWRTAPGEDPTLLRRSRPRKEAKAPPDVTPDKPKEEPWTVERFVKDFVTDAPQEQKVVAAKARAKGLKHRQVDDLIALSIAEGKAWRWSFAGTKTVYLANREQPVTETAGGPDVAA